MSILKIPIGILVFVRDRSISSQCGEYFVAEEIRIQTTYAILNNPPNSLADRHAQEFISQIAKAISNCGIIPLIGSGLSADSGLPIISDLRHYLQRCIALALGVDIVDVDEQRERRRRWNPRKDKWPPLADPRRPQGIPWSSLVYNEWLSRSQIPHGGEELAVFQEAFGALAEWRTSLSFLARLTSSPQGADQQDVLYLSVPDQDVMDAFWLHVTAGRRPTLGHRMLAHLASLLRVTQVLTTNFDELLEQAFGSVGRHLTVYDVQMDSGLPPFAVLRHPPSLIKMHGGRYGLRGDYSLDGLPSEDDRKHFVSYLTGNSDPEATSLQNHLLVMGCSATDRRITSLIQHAWKEFGKGTSFKPLRVFWICYTEDDLKRVELFAREQLKAKPLRGHQSMAVSSGTLPSIAPQLIALRHTDVGLLFLEMYQILANGLPPSGVLFPSHSRLAIPPQPVHEYGSLEPYGSTKEAKLVLERRATRERAQSALQARIDRAQQVRFTGDRFVVFTSHLDGGMPPHGVTTIAADVFHQLQSRGHTCVWLDMSDISSTDDLFEQLLDAVCYRAGVEDWMPVYLQEDARARATEIRRVTLATGRNWVIFLNARETPGANSRNEGEGTTNANGWLDNQAMPEGQDVDDKSATGAAFLDLVHELSGPTCPNVTIVLLCRWTTPGLIEQIRERGSAQHSGFPTDTWVVLDGDCLEFERETAVERVIDEWAITTKQQEFLQSLVLMQRTRYLATFWEQPFLQVTDSRLNLETLNEWLMELEQRNIVRRKTGGFVWLHTQTREYLRSILEDSATYAQNAGKSLKKNVKARLKKWNSAKLTPTIHWQLAHWYRHVYLSSSDPGAVFEAIYHACEASSAVLAVDPPPFYPTRALHWAAVFLRQSARAIRARGFSRGSCRRLGTILQRLSDLRAKGHPQTDVQAVIDLQKRCVIVMRGIAREVAEHSTAYWRHRQLCELVVCGEIKQTKKKAHLKALSESPPDNYQSERIVDALKEWACSPEDNVKLGRENKSSHSIYLRQPLWIRWWRWAGELARASRSYSEGEGALLKALSAVSERRHQVKKDVRVIGKTSKDVSHFSFERIARGASQKTEDALNSLLESVAGCLSKEVVVALGKPTANRWGVCVEIVRVLDEYLQLLLLFDSLVRRLDGSPADTYLKPALACFHHAETILESVEEAWLQQGAETPSVTFRSRARLLTNRSVIELRRGNMIDARRCLNEAEAQLAMNDPHRDSISWALLDLHRAEIAIEVASSNETKSSLKRSICFATYCSQLRKIPSADKITELLGMDWSGVLASLKDATAALNQAEVVLLTRRRNVWWATWFFQRRLKIIELELWATVGQERQPIPYLGLEAAPRRTATLADEMLDNSLRMVRLDAYRLATVVEVYANCVLALHFRIGQDKTTQKMRRRQEDMRARLIAANERLENVHKQRKAFGSTKEQYNCSSHELVDLYVGRIINEHVQSVLDRTEMIHH